MKQSLLIGAVLLAAPVLPGTIRFFHMPRDGAAPRTFELVEQGDKGVPVEAKLVGKNVVELTVPDGMSSPTRARYAWSPDPDVNLVNSADLPATPFEISL